MGTPRAQKINRYGIAFKLRAVQLSHQPGVHMESFFHSMKAEDLQGRRFDNDEQLRQALRSYIRVLQPTPLAFRPTLPSSGRL